MIENSKKWQLAASYLQSQNKDPGIRTFRDLLSLSHLIENYLEERLNSDGINRTQRMIVLLILAKNDYMTPTEISKMTYHTIDTINKSINVLNKLGLTESVRSEKDRRIRKVTLTEKGVELAEKDIPLRSMAFFQAMDGFSNKEAKVFISYINRLHKQIVHIKKENSKKSPGGKRA
jgi:DNA-binding MarR family transcriptional regulator